METLRFVMTSTFYPPHHLGGDAVQVRYLAEELAERGHEVHVLYSRDAYRLKRKDEPPKPDYGKVQVHSLESPYGRMTPLRAYAFGSSSFVLGRYRKLVDEVRPDIVHHHNISLLGHGLLRKVGEYRQLYTAHDQWLLCQKNNMMRGGMPCSGSGCLSCVLSSMRPPQRWRKKINLTGIDCLICPSEFMADALKKLKLATAVLPNFSPDPPADIPDIPEYEFYLYVGVMEEHKGIRQLLEAFSKSDKKLVLIGSGSMSGWVERIIKDRKLEPRVKSLGSMAEGKWPYMKKALALIIPSTGPENHPLVALEALSVGTQVICTDMGGTKEIVSKIPGGLVIPIKDLELRLRDINPPAIFKESIIKAYQEHFSAEKYINDYLKIARNGC